MRFDCAVNLEYRLPEQPKIQGISFTKNVSKEGVRFPISKNLAEGTNLEMRFDIPGDETAVFAKGKVIWTDKKSVHISHLYDIGVKFTHLDNFNKFRLIEYAYGKWLGAAKKKGK